jgi:quinol monooxygenase YgiN
LLLTVVNRQCVWHPASVTWAGRGEVSNLIIESLRIVVRAAKREELRRALAAWIGPTQVQPGCMNCRILQEDNEPRSFFYEAQWKTPDDLLRHLRSEHYKRLLVLMDLGEEPPVVEFHTVTETKGLDLIQLARNAF